MKERGTHVRRLQPQRRHGVLNLQLPDSAPDLVLHISLQQIVGLIVADVVALSEVFINTALEFTTDTSRRSYLTGLANVDHKIGIIKIKVDLV